MRSRGVVVLVCNDRKEKSFYKIFKREERNQILTPFNHSLFFQIA